MECHCVVNSCVSIDYYGLLQLYHLLGRYCMINT